MKMGEFLVWNCDLHLVGRTKNMGRLLLFFIAFTQKTIPSEQSQQKI